MSNKYLPLYRKYRPQTFKDLIGQENITKALGNAINLNKISHAYLFCGPRGTGKTSSARILAKSLNCKEGPTLEPCGVCPSCQDIINSNPMDVIEMDAASNRTVEDIQKILEKIQYVPVYGKYKIYVIDEVHMLSNTAFNSLLKTLEEPPENVIFILATTEIQKVPDTIISRCQRFDFKRITIEDIVKRLRYIADTEKIKISDEAILTIARTSAGGMRDSLSLLDQLSILGVEKEITPDDVNELLGKISYDLMFKMIELINLKNIQECLELLDSIYCKGNEPLQILTNIIEYLRNLLIVKNGSDEAVVLELTQVNKNCLEKLREQSKDIAQDKIISWITTLNSYIYNIKNSTNRYLSLELCLIETTNFAAENVQSELIKRLEVLEARLQSAPAMQSPTATSIPKINSIEKPVFKAPEIKSQAEKKLEKTVEVQPEQAKAEEIKIAKEEVKVEIKPEITDESEQEKTESLQPSSNEQVAWSELLQGITSIPSKMFFLNLANPVKIDKDEVIITFVRDMFTNQAKDDAKFLPLKAAIEAYFGTQNHKITIKTSENEPKTQKKEVKKTEPVKQSAPVKQEKTQEDDESVKEILMDVKKEESQKSPQIDIDEYSDQTKLVTDLFNGKIIAD